MTATAILPIPTTTADDADVIIPQADEEAEPIDPRAFDWSDQTGLILCGSAAWLDGEFWYSLPVVEAAMFEGVGPRYGESTKAFNLVDPANRKDKLPALRSGKNRGAGAVLRSEVRHLNAAGVFEYAALIKTDRAKDFRRFYLARRERLAKAAAKAKQPQPV